LYKYECKKGIYFISVIYIKRNKNFFIIYYFEIILKCFEDNCLRDSEYVKQQAEYEYIQVSFSSTNRTFLSLTSTVSSHLCDDIHPFPRILRFSLLLPHISLQHFSHISIKYF